MKHQSAGIESYSEHLLAQAIVDAADAENMQLRRAENFQAMLDGGATADYVTRYDRHHCIGKLPFIIDGHEV